MLWSSSMTSSTSKECLTTPRIMALVWPDSCVTMIYMSGYRGGKMSRVFPPKGLNWRGNCHCHWLNHTVSSLAIAEMSVKRCRWDQYWLVHPPIPRWVLELWTTVLSWVQSWSQKSQVKEEKKKFSREIRYESQWHCHPQNEGTPSAVRSVDPKRFPRGSRGLE